MIHVSHYVDEKIVNIYEVIELNVAFIQCQKGKLKVFLPDLNGLYQFPVIFKLGFIFLTR